MDKQVSDADLKPITHFLKNRDAWIRAVVNDPCLGHAAARVGVHLAMRMRGTQQFCWPSIEHIANETGVSRRAVSDALDALCGEPDKLTGEERVQLLRRKSRPNLGNVYWLFFPWE